VTFVLVFVYGSLKRGFRHHDVLGAAVFMRALRTAPGFRLVRYGSYPALVPSEDSSESVSGELYQVDASDLPRLDQFEDVPELYQRESIPLEDGTHADAYVISARRAELLPSLTGGVWREEW
jgi:gamma-glutamylcyclotransferase (GGCT)/AIG2-like uncharacterized protein YtfP